MNQVNDVKRLKQLRKMLEDERRVLINGIQQHSLAGIDAHGDLVDQSTDLSEREQLMGLEERDRQRLMDIEAAITKLDKGDYGICSMCNEAIPMERLKAIPSAELCVKCKQVAERDAWV